MTRDQLEHLIGAAAVIADDDTIVVIGSQAVLLKSLMILKHLFGHLRGSPGEARTLAGRGLVRKREPPTKTLVLTRRPPPLDWSATGIGRKGRALSI